MESSARIAEVCTTPAPVRLRILLAEDDDDLRGYVASALRLKGYEVVEARNGLELLTRVKLGSESTPPYDVIVTDVRMPGVTGTSVLRGLSEVGIADRVIIVSAFADRETVRSALALGASAVLAKPFRIATLLGAIRRTVEQAASEAPCGCTGMGSGRSWPGDA